MKELSLQHIIGPQPYATNSFIIMERDGVAVVIDPVAELKQYMDVLKEENAKLKYIFLTHGHDDHTNSLKDLKEATGAKVCGFAIDAELYNYEIDILLEDGQKIAISNDTEEEFEIMHAPGHTPGSCCYKFEDMLFVGDTLFPGSIGRTDMENGDMDVMKVTLKKIANMQPDNIEIYPGHGPFTNLRIEKERNPFLRFEE